MFLNKKIDCKKKFALFFIFLFFIPGIFAKPKQKANAKVFTKMVHPREYNFDLADSEKLIYIEYNRDVPQFEYTMDFTEFVKSDMPQIGDKINIFFNGKSSNHVDEIYYKIISNNKTISDEKMTFATDVKKGKNQIQVSCRLKSNAVNDFKIQLFYGGVDNIKVIEQTTLVPKKTTETTNTVKEEKQEQKAIKKNIEIVEVKADLEPLISEEDLRKFEEYTKRLEEEKIAKEKEQKEREEAEQLEKERLEKLRIEKEEQEALIKAIESARQAPAVEIREKEYLQDFMVSEELEIVDDIHDIDYEVIQNPNEKDAFGQTLLMKAAKAGNEWQINNLLAQGADVNLQDKDGWTALMYAVRYHENLNTVKMLLNSKANVKIKNNFDSTALLIAVVYNNNPEIIKLLLDYYNITEKEVMKSFVMLLSTQTSEYSLIAKINIFINKSIPLNSFYDGKTPLMYAAQFGTSTKVLKLLIDNNSITTLRSSEGKTAFEYATENKNLAKDNYYWMLNKNSR